VDKTESYALEVAETVMSPFSRQATGGLEAPMADENVRLYSAKGGSAITVANNTTSAVVIFDPEATLRNGQFRVTIIERDSADTINAVKSIAMGRKATDFQAVGVVSSGLKCFNSSGTDVVGGTQSAAVLTSVPRDVSKITSSDLANFCNNHERDLVSGVTSREDATATVSISEHFGKRMALVRDNTLSNVIQRTWDDGIDDTASGGVNRRATAGYTSTFHDAAGAAALLWDATATTFATAIADPLKYFLVDSSRLDEDKNPLTFATYSASVKLHVRTGGVTNVTDVFYLSFAVYGLDADNKVVASNLVSRDIYNLDQHRTNYAIDATVSSSTVPIHRVVIQAILQSPNMTTPADAIDVGDSTCAITAYEETADVPGRAVHFCVFEGLNSNATINISSAATMAGIPDSSNVFIGSVGGTRPDVYDDNAVSMFLKSVSRVVPRAYTVAGLDTVEREVKAMYGNKEVSVAFQAMSFGRIAQGVKDLGKKAKMPAKMISANVMQPMERTAGEVASMLDRLPGAQAAMAAQALRVGSDVSQSLRTGDVMDMRKMAQTRRDMRQLGL